MFGVIIVSAIPALIVAGLGRLIQRRDYAFWKNALYGGLVLIAITGAVLLYYRGSVEEAIAACQAAPPGTTYDCEDENLVLAFIVLIGGVALIEHLVFSLLLKFTASRD